MADAAIGGPAIRDRMPEAAETRCGTRRTPQRVQMRRDTGSPCTAKDTRILAHPPGPPAWPEARLPPGEKPHSTGLSEAVVHTLQPNPVQSNAVPVVPVIPVIPGLLPAWFRDGTAHHPHSRPKMRPPREPIAAQTAPTGPEPSECPLT